MKPWNQLTNKKIEHLRFVLQWGHGDEAVESVTTPYVTADLFQLLQWGHGDEAVESIVQAAMLAAHALASMGPRR